MNIRLPFAERCIVTTGGVRQAERHKVLLKPKPTTLERCTDMTTSSRLTAAFTVVLAVYVIFAASAEGQGSAESDRAALEALYDATGGANWNNDEGWRTDRPLQEWFGVPRPMVGSLSLSS